MYVCIILHLILHYHHHLPLNNHITNPFIQMVRFWQPFDQMVIREIRLFYFQKIKINFNFPHHFNRRYFSQLHLHHHPAIKGYLHSKFVSNSIHLYLARRRSERITYCCLFLFLVLLHVATWHCGSINHAFYQLLLSFLALIMTMLPIFLYLVFSENSVISLSIGTGIFRLSLDFVLILKVFILFLISL